jgi:GTPase SAR1 family protein
LDRFLLKTPAQNDAPNWDWRFLGNLQCPGLVIDYAQFETLKGELPKTAAVLNYKRINQDAWVTFVGGTGTGKSTLFNGLCESSLSLAGVERPKTGGPVAYVHKDSSIEEEFPLEGIRIIKESLVKLPPQPSSGMVGHLIALGHERQEWRHLILVDTPDLDSVELSNRRMTEDLLRLSDAVVFVSSEEKYADEVPNAVLGRILRSEKPCFFILNKVRDRDSGSDLIRVLEGFGISLQENRLYPVPYIPSPLPEKLQAEQSFQEFRGHLLSAVKGKPFRTHREKDLNGLLNELREGTGRMISLLAQEESASRAWLSRLTEIRESISMELTETLQNRYMQESRQQLGEKVRALFAKYDVLAGPRRLIREIVLTPLRMVGLGKQTRPQFSKEDLQKIRREADYNPVLRAVEKFHIRVLKELSPADGDSPLFHALRKEDLSLTREEVMGLLAQAFERLDSWLEKTFEDLARGIPATKKWGIYTTSVLWGMLIISMEVAVGGGFSIVDAAIDSALAPFVTRGAVELFAAQEIRKIARELGEQYRQALTAPLQEQHDSYVRCLRSVMAAPEAAAGLKTFHAGIPEPSFSSGDR